MQPPQTQADVLALSRRVDGLFAAAFRITRELGPPELTYVADAFDTAHGGAIAQASRAICEACRRVAMTGEPFHQPLVRTSYPTLVVAAVPFGEAAEPAATFGVIFHCDDENECSRRLAALAAIVAG